MFIIFSGLQSRWPVLPWHVLQMCETVLHMRRNPGPACGVFLSGKGSASARCLESASYGMCLTFTVWGDWAAIKNEPPSRHMTPKHMTSKWRCVSAERPSEHMMSKRRCTNHRGLNHVDLGKVHSLYIHINNMYSRLSLPRLRLSRITAYLEEKIWSFF